MQLFRKKIEPRCAYCEKGAPIGADQVACRGGALRELSL